MNSLLIFFIFSLGKTLDLNFSYPVVASECSDEKHYAKVSKLAEVEEIRKLLLSQGQLMVWKLF